MGLGSSRFGWIALAGVTLWASASSLSQAAGHLSFSSPRYVASVHYRVTGYRPQPVPAEELPGYQNSVTPLRNPNIPVDAQGVALWPYKGHKLYHPLVIARYGIVLLHTYRVTRKPVYLDRAKVNANFLINTAVSRDEALYFPYRFRYALFGNRRDLMRAPWYSAMTQGTVLGLFVRLHAVTGEQHWRTAADSTFATFVKGRSATRPWTVFVSRRYDHRYLWFEEYPKNPPTQVLNGHMYALFGVWEYALATGNATAVDVFDGGATTIRHQVHRFRVRGEVSYYSLRVRIQYKDYHAIHIGQLKLLARMTGDSWFAREARLFARDARP